MALSNHPPGGETKQKTQAEKKIDLQALAEKVYELLKKELRVEQERLGRHRRR
jgi:hypothetical protein